MDFFSRSPGGPGIRPGMGHRRASRSPHSPGGPPKRRSPNREHRTWVRDGHGHALHQQQLDLQSPFADIGDPWPARAGTTPSRGALWFVIPCRHRRQRPALRPVPAFWNVTGCWERPRLSLTFMWCARFVSLRRPIPGWRSPAWFLNSPALPRSCRCSARVPIPGGSQGLSA